MRQAINRTKKKSFAISSWAYAKTSSKFKSSLNNFREFELKETSGPEQIALTLISVVKPQEMLYL